MKVLILTQTEVEDLLPMEECILVMREALTALAKGQAHQPLRMVVRPPESSDLMILMPSVMSGAQAAFGLKALCIFPENPAMGKDAHQGAVMLLSAESGLAKYEPRSQQTRQQMPHLEQRSTPKEAASGTL